MNHKNILSLFVAIGMLSCAGMGGMDIWEAARQGRLQMVKNFVENGTKVDEKGFEGETPLHSAASGGNLAVVKYLVEKGADINEHGDYGTPLHLAARRDHLDVVKHLIENGAQIDAQNNEGETPLHDASYCCRLEIVKYLIEKGAQIDKQNNNGETPLHFAARWWEGHLEVVKAICEPLLRGLNQQPQRLLKLLGMKNNEGTTAVALAQENKLQDIVIYLTHITEKAKTAKNPLLTALEKTQKADVTFAYKTADF